MLRYIKKFVDEYILQYVLSDRILAPYLFFWARVILKLQKPFIIGVTGSVGKTTTTDMIAAALTHEDAQRIVGIVQKTSNNMNDDIGLPLTVLLYDNWLNWRRKKLVEMCLLPFRALSLATSSRYPKMFVLEFGTHWKGHLHRLTKLAPPNIAVVTTIGPAHLERLKTLEGVVREKSAVVSAALPSGLVILGDGHTYVYDLERETKAPVIKVTGRGVELSQNITRAVGRHLGIPEEIISSALAKFKPARARLNILRFSNLTVIDDSCNANPVSMQLGLDTLSETARSGQRRIAILGIMAELGEEGPRYHEEIGTYSRGRADVVIGIGDLAKHYHPAHWFDSNRSFMSEMQSIIRAGDCLLLKGSASARLAEIVAELREVYENSNSPSNRNAPN